MARLVDGLASFLLAVALSLVSMGSSAVQAASGAEDFQMFCSACHTIGGGRTVGPDLIGVHERRSSDWLIKFVSSSQALIKEGDADAVAVFAQYSNIIMPDAPISPAQIEAVLEHIALQSSAAPTEAQAAPATSTTAEIAASPEQIVLGQNLFQGTVRFSEGGPTCNSCHHIKNDAVIGGGILARELTTVFSSMGREGVRAILGQAPFPVMQAAYENQPLTEEETNALVAFLKDADEQHAYQQPRDYGVGLLVSGIVGCLIIFGLCGFIWRGRKKGSVNQAIYDRQIKST